MRGFPRFDSIRRMVNFVQPPAASEQQKRGQVGGRRLDAIMKIQ
jgi:hypothetical protein